MAPKRILLRLGNALAFSWKMSFNVCRQKLNAGISAHELQQNIDPVPFRDRLDLRNLVSERTRKNPDLIADPQGVNGLKSAILSDPHPQRLDDSRRDMRWRTMFQRH